MCVRASYKYGDRIKARRHSVPADVFREEIMMLVDTALGRLVQSAEQLKKRVSADSDHSVLFPDELEGMGKNYLTLDDAEKGIDGYRFILRFYALREYFSDAGPGSGTVRSDRAGVYSGKLMERFGLAERPAAELAAVYREILDRFLFLTESSKEKDMIRGEKIIPDYRQTHHAASEDPVITRLKEWIFSEKDKVSSL